MGEVGCEQVTVRAESRSGPGGPAAVLSEEKMNYKLSFENETYSVEDIHFPTESTLAQDAAGKPFSFVSPIRLPTGQRCLLRSDSGGYHLLVNACLGFTFTPRYFVSGVIATRDLTPALAA